MAPLSLFIVEGWTGVQQYPAVLEAGEDVREAVLEPAVEAPRWGSRISRPPVCHRPGPAGTGRPPLPCPELRRRQGGMSFGHRRHVALDEV